MFRLVLFIGLVVSAAAQQPDLPAPPDFSGTYTFLEDGETVQINITDGKVDGFISRLGDLESDKGTFIDQFFSKAEVKGDKLAFTTKPVHSVWFEFKGKVERGPGKLRSDEKYFLLRGTLTRYYTDHHKKTTAKERTVVFESLPDGLMPAGQ
jgi:hypothetical protein